MRNILTFAPLLVAGSTIFARLASTATSAREEPLELPLRIALVEENVSNIEATFGDATDEIDAILSVAFHPNAEASIAGARALAKRIFGELEVFRQSAQGPLRISLEKFRELSDSCRNSDPPHILIHKTGKWEIMAPCKKYVTIVQSTRMGAKKGFVMLTIQKRSLVARHWEWIVLILVVVLLGGGVAVWYWVEKGKRHRHPAEASMVEGA